MPGPRAPASLLLAFLAAAFVVAPVAAQDSAPRPSVRPPPAALPVPSPLELSKLIWSSILAVDHANRSGNYSVLRDMSATGFQINNNAATLAQVFAGIRNSGIDLSDVLLVPPTYNEAPRQVAADVIEVKGVFQLRPTSIMFDLFYQWEQGRWKLYGIDIQPVSMIEAQPAN